MLAALRQQFSPGLLAQVLQHVQLLIKLLGSAARAGLGDFPQPFTAMSGVVDVPTSTRNGPAAIQSFQAIHDWGKIFDDGQITAGKFPQHAYPGHAVIDRLQIIETQPVGQLRASILSLLLPCWSKAILRGLHTAKLATRGLSRSYSQAAQVPSSNVTDKVPRSPAKNSRMVAAFVSRMDSMITLPMGSITAAQIVAW